MNLTDNEVVRTAFPFLTRRKDHVMSEEVRRLLAPYLDRAYEEIKHNPNGVCPCCKHRNNPPVTDVVILNRFASVYASIPFTAYQCAICSAYWSVYKPIGEQHGT